VPCLRDQNAKVNLQAQTAFQQMLPVIASDLSRDIKHTIATVCVNLRSRNMDLHRSALRVLDAVTEHVGKCCLLLN